jgi:hypothetical protein
MVIVNDSPPMHIPEGTEVNLVFNRFPWTSPGPQVGGCGLPVALILASWRLVATGIPNAGFCAGGTGGDGGLFLSSDRARHI